MRTRRPLIAIAAAILLVSAGAVGRYFEGAGGDMTRAAEKLLASLAADQKTKASMPFDDPKRLDWHFIPKAERKGLQVKEMNPDQRKLAHALLHAGLSQVGFDKATTIMSLEAILHELEKGKGTNIRDAERYYFTIFGAPAEKGTWGWSVEGHHLSLNFAVKDGKLISATPAFFGANPAIVRSNVGVGPKPDTRTLAREETLAFELLGSLSPDQRKAAVLAEKAPADITGTGGVVQAPRSLPAGLSATSFTAAQSKTLWSLLETYAGNMPKEVGDAWLGEIKKAGTEKLNFAWEGADKPGVGHYYRVQGPTFVLEFVNVQADSAGNPANHIHSVWRSLAGDFGISI